MAWSTNAAALSMVASTSPPPAAGVRSACFCARSIRPLSKPGAFGSGCATAGVAPVRATRESPSASRACGTSSGSSTRAFARPGWLSLRSLDRRPQIESVAGSRRAPAPSSDTATGHPRCPVGSARGRCGALPRGRRGRGPRGDLLAAGPHAGIADRRGSGQRGGGRRAVHPRRGLRGLDRRGRPRRARPRTGPGTRCRSRRGAAARGGAPTPRCGRRPPRGSRPTDRGPAPCPSPVQASAGDPTGSQWPPSLESGPWPLAARPTCPSCGT